MKRMVMDKELIESIADDIARSMYHKILMLKFLPEIDAIEKDKIKGLKGKEIDEFFEKLMCC